MDFHFIHIFWLSFLSLETGIFHPLFSSKFRNIFIKYSLEINILLSLFILSPHPWSPQIYTQNLFICCWIQYEKEWAF